MHDHSDRSLAGLYLAQFLGAFNDNAFKLFLALLALRAITGSDYETAAQAETTTAFVIFTLPLMLISFPAAWLADRCSKRKLLVYTKAFEVLLMIAGSFALWLEPHSGPVALGVLAGMGAQSAIFSPAKYAILPELVGRTRLLEANGTLELCTFTAIILGTLAGGGLLELVGEHVWLAGAMLALLSLLGLVSIRTLPATPAADPDCGFVDNLRLSWRSMRSSRILWLAVLGSTIFWGLASLLTQDLLIYGKSVLGLSDTTAGIPMGISVLGIGLGSFFVGRLSRPGVETGWIPLGGIGLSITALVMGFAEPGFAMTLLWMLLLGLSSGLVVVPINTLLQVHAPADRRGSVIALANGMAFAGVLCGTLAAGFMASLGLGATEIFLGAGLLSVLATIWALTKMPESALRFGGLILTRLVYRLKVRGAVHLPESGPALLVANHWSFVDVLLLQAACPRRIRFIADAEYYQRPLLGQIMRLVGAIPISRSAPPREMLNSIRRAGELLDQGEILCIFAEGEISRSGNLLPFQRGFERILKGRQVPIIPASLDRLWGSLFSFAGNRSLLPRLRAWPCKVRVSFGEALDARTPAHEVREASRLLSTEAWIDRQLEREPLHRIFVRSARRRPWRMALADPQHVEVSRIALCAQGVAVARALRAAWQDQRLVGVLLPPSLAGSVVNLAVSLSGRAVVNLNYSLGEADMNAIASQAGLESIVTSRAFVERLGVDLPAGIRRIYVEDLMAGIGFWQRAVAMIQAACMPLRLLERRCGADRSVSGGDRVTVIFSSGSTGSPKGVELSHANLAANVEATAQVLPLESSDRLLATLPLFHAFGTFTLWFGLHREIALVCQPSPLDARGVGAMVERHRATMLVSTPTFLQLYLKRCAPSQFGSLRIVLAGGEKMPAGLSDAFIESFGVRPLEGYGCTECSPVVALSSPDFRAPGFFQPGSRVGSVGQPLPGVAIRIVDPDRGSTTAVGSEGMVMVRGPNLMNRYLDRPELTAEVIADGWYRTGDIGYLDRDGYLHITDRLSRFAKIGGEMVPLGRIEEALQSAAGLSEPAFAVAAIPCPGRGEKLVVMHTVDRSALPAVFEGLSRSALPKLFVPKAGDFHHISALPLLGSGKLDLGALRDMARELAGNPEKSQA